MEVIRQVQYDHLPVRNEKQKGFSVINSFLSYSARVIIYTKTTMSENNHHNSCLSGEKEKQILRKTENKIMK